MHMTAPRTLALLRAICAALLTSGCGYSTAGKAARIPTSFKTLAVPAFVNQTRSYHIEQTITAAVVKEFNTRSRFQVTPDEAGADAVLRGTVLSTQVSPLTYDSQTGRASSALITVTLRVVLTGKDGAVLFDNENYTFREEYQVSREISSFFEEESPALERLSRDLAHTLFSDVLENY